MTVKTITITESAYTRLKQRKMPNESFSEIVMRLTSKQLTADDIFGIMPGTDEELQTELKALKEQRWKIHREIEERRKKYDSN